LRPLDSLAEWSRAGVRSIIDVRGMLAMVALAACGRVHFDPLASDGRTNANGWSHITRTSAPAGGHQAHWDQDVAGTYCSGTVAFRSSP
jgi:hypothetical protein